MLDAIELALFGIGSGKKAPGWRREDLISWGEDEAHLTLEFSAGGERYRIDRRIGKGHRAKLEQATNGGFQLVSASVRQIERSVGEIIGMDRDAYEKLVYVRQKDLDALKNLAKQSREAMMNKVMGMEIFDQAIDAAKEDRRERKGERALIGAALPAAENDWRLYQTKQREFQDETSKLERLKQTLKDTKKDLDAAKTEVQANEWLETQETLTGKRDRIRGTLTEVQQQIEDLEGMVTKRGKLETEIEKLGNPEEAEASLKRRKTAIRLAQQREKDAQVATDAFEKALKDRRSFEEYRPVAENATRLRTLQRTVQDENRQVRGHKEQLDKIDSRIQKEEERLDLPASEADSVRKGLPRARRRLLIQFVASLVSGSISLIVGLLVFFPVVFGGIGLLVLAAWILVRYVRIERIESQALTLLTLVSDRESTASKLRTAQSQLSTALSRAGEKSLDTLDRQLGDAMKQLQDSTGLGSPDAFEDGVSTRKRVARQRKKDVERFTKEAEEHRAEAAREDSVHPIPKSANIAKLLDEAEGRVRTKQTLEATEQALQGQIKRLRSKDLQGSRDALTPRLDTAEGDLTRHNDNLPAQVRGREYSKTEHDAASKTLEGLRDQFGEQEKKKSGSEVALKWIKEGLDETKEGFEEYPGLKERHERLESDVNVLDRVAFEIRATGAELRGKVLPAARYTLNQLLPIITDGRYADLEISDDFRFKAFSAESGSFKDRDVFSGGTQDQFLIALRLAFTKAILDSRVQADEYSLYLDECTASSDASRKAGIFEVLGALAETFTQIFIVTHEDISHLVDHYILLDLQDNGQTSIQAMSWEATES